MEPADTQPVPALGTLAFCGAFWGSHGCVLGNTTHDTHLCAVNEDGQVQRCSQMVQIGPIVEHEDGTYGHAKVRFWYAYETKEPRWGEWDEDWTWFN